MAIAQDALDSTTNSNSNPGEAPSPPHTPSTSALPDVAQYVPTVSHVYSRAYVALEETPTWGEEPPSRASSRFMITPVSDCVGVESVSFSPSPLSPPKQTGAKNIALGTGLVVLGLLMMIFPSISTRVTVLLTGVFLVISGIATLLLSVLSLGTEGVLTWQVVASVCHVIVGAYMLESRHVGATLLTIIIAVWIVVKGFAREAVVVSSVVGVGLVLVSERWWGVPGFILGYDITLIGVCVALIGVSTLRGGGRDTEPLLPEHRPTTYSA